MKKYLGIGAVIILMALMIFSTANTAEYKAITGIDTTNFEINGGVLSNKALGVEAADIAADAVTTVKILDNNVTLAKLVDFTGQGYILRGGAAGAPEEADFSTDGQIGVGDGTDFASVAVSGDATLANTGALTIAAGAVEESMLAVPGGAGLNTKRVAKIRFLFSDQPGSGTWASPVTLPDNAIITRCWLDIDATFGGDGDDTSTISIDSEGAADLYAVSAIKTATDWDAGLKDCKTKGDDPGDPSTFVKTTAARNITVTVAILATDTLLDEGSMNIFLEYVVSD